MRVEEHGRPFVQFCVEDPIRYQLLYQRTIPGFEPSPESYASPRPSRRSTGPRYGVRAQECAGLRRVDRAHRWLAAQQNSNEPGGNRWVRLLDGLVDMYVAHYGKTPLGRQP